MPQSMTGFGSRETEIIPLGVVGVELKSSNHKFLDIILHLPEGLLYLEDKIKKEIGAKVKRGRITCVVSITGTPASRISINKELLQNYLVAIKGIKQEFHIKDEVSINTLMHLPGIFSLSENLTRKPGIWPQLKILVNQAVDDLAKMRQKEGNALYVLLKKRTEALKADLAVINTAFKKVTKEKLLQINTDEERASFLKDTDITEEIDRLAFYINNFMNTLSKSGPVGKELDFITQEMQRETNTMGAKSFDTVISGKVVRLKSEIEKIREQLQNIE